MNMPLEFFENGVNSGCIQNPNDYFRDLHQAAIDQRWEVTSSRYTIKEQSDFGSTLYQDIEAWIDPVVGMTSRGMTNGDDFRKLVFRDINHPVKRGLYYQFDDNTWLTYFTDEFNSLTKDAGVRRCNNVLRIVDPENGSVFSIPCSVDYDMLSPSIQVTKSILTPNSHAVVMVQGNTDTLRLFKINTRYILGGRPFKLYAYQNALLDKSISPNPTLLYLDLYLDEIHAQDDIPNQLAYNGEYVYTVEIDSGNMELTNGATGVLNTSVALNGTEVNRENVWSSSDPSVVKIDNDGRYKVLGNDGSNCELTATLKGNEMVKASVRVDVVAVESLQAKVVIEPLFDKLRQYETLAFEVQATYGAQLYHPTATTVSLSQGSIVLSNQYLSIVKSGNNYQLIGSVIAPTKQTLYIHVENATPQFQADYELPIAVVSMMG